MKKRILFLVSIISLMCLVAFALMASAADNVQIAFGTVYEGSITAENRSDTYAVTLTQPGRVNLIVNSSGDGRLPAGGANVIWRNADDEAIRSDTSSWSFPYNRSMDLEAGTYYITISSRGMNMGTYSLVASFSAPSRTAVKPNDSIDDAQPLTTGQSVRGYISYQERADFYKYELTQAGRLSLNILSEAGMGLPGGGANVIWYNSNGESIRSDTEAWDFPYSPYMDLEIGTYYVSVSGRSNNTGTYSLSGAFDPSGRTGAKPNHSRGIAQLLSSGHSIRGFISHQERTDFYRYELAQAGRLTVSITSEIGFGLPTAGATVQWLNANGENIRNDSSNWAFPYNRALDLEAGTYYINVSGRNNSTGRYNLTIADSFTQGYRISVAASPSEGGTATGGGAFSQGEMADLSAQPNDGYVFDGWYEGTVLVGTAEDLRFPVASGRLLEARFSLQRAHQVTVAAYASPPNGGTVTGSGTFDEGDIVTLTAVPSDDYVFDSWYESGARVSLNAALSFTATASRTLEARFISAHTQQITVTASASPPNGGTITGGGSFNIGATVTLRAIPNAGWRIASWEDGQSILSENATFSFTAAPEWDSSIRDITAVFVRESPAVIENPHSSWAREELELAFREDLVPPILRDSGVDFREPITRAEFAGIVVLAYENLSGVRLQPTSSNPFTDTNDINARMAYDAGLMVGVSDSSFAPDMLLNRETAATALTRVFKRWSIAGWSFANDRAGLLSFDWPELFADDALISEWARESVYFMAANGIIRGMDDNIFAPADRPGDTSGSATATREQALLIALRMVLEFRG